MVSDPWGRDVLEVPDLAIPDAASRYYESEMSQWEETKSDPAGAFLDNLRFGATGPAPSLEPGFLTGIDMGDGIFGSINRTAWNAADEAAGGPGTRWALRAAIVAAVIMLVSYTVGQLFTIEV